MQGWGGSDYSKSIVVDEKDHPYTGTNYAWVRARVLGGKTNIWGRLALRLSDYDFKGKSHDGYGEDWPIGYADIEPYYDKVDLLLGISGVKENLPQLPDGMFQRPVQAESRRGASARPGSRRWDGSATPYRAGVTTDGLMHNKYRSQCYGRGACSRRVGGLRHPRGVRFADRPHLSRDGHGAPDDPAPTRRRTRCTSIPTTGKAHGVGFVDTATGKSYSAKGRRSSCSPPRRSSLRGCCCSRSRRRIPTASATRQRPRRPQFLRAPDGARASPAS